jgi:hypothetical protein
MEPATPSGEGGRGGGGLHHANQAAAFDYYRRQAAIAARVLSCAGRTFEAIGAGPATQEVIFWNLYVTRNLGRDQIADKPSEFVEGLKAIYGEAGMVVFEYKMIKELKLEFDLNAELDKQPPKARGLADVLRLVARAKP